MRENIVILDRMAANNLHLVR